MDIFTKMSMHLPTHTSVLPFVKNQTHFLCKQTFIENEIKPRINTRIIIILIIIIIIIIIIILIIIIIIIIIIQESQGKCF